MKLMSLRQAAKEGVRLLRLPHWAFEDDHVEIDIIDGDLGPWIHFHCPTSCQVNGTLSKVDRLLVGVDLDKEEWVPYAAT